MSRRGGVAAVVGVAMVAMGLVLPSQPSTGAAPAPGEGRLAFTDGKDVVRQVSLYQSETSEGTPLLLPVQPADGTTVQVSGRHSGEVRGEQVADQESPAGGYAFVSTRPTASAPAQDDPDGEVWYHAVDPETDAERDVQVTDDASAQAHPDALVMQKACYATDGPVTIDVAFASDRSGNWDIWVARLVRNPAPGSGCDDLVVESVEQVTTDPADDMWPSWAISRAGTRSIVFASTRSDPRGDLYQVVADPGDPLPPPASAYTQLTEGPEADSQPAARLWVDSPQVCPGDAGGGLAAPIEPTWVAFTRASDDDPRGSLAVLDLDDPGGGVMGLGVPESSEPVWSPDGGFVSYRSTAEDPDGDVLIGRFVRECPPDLAVESVTVPADPITFNSRFDTFVRVVNNGPRPASGQIVVEFSPVVANPTECVAGVCQLTVPTLAQGEAVEFAWTTIEFPPADMVVVGPAPLTTALGDGTVTATVTVDGPVPDAVPGNDTGSATFTVAPRPIDVQVVADPYIDGVSASPRVLAFSDATPSLTTTVSVLVYNPGPIPVTTTIDVASDSGLALSGGSRTASRTIAELPPTPVGSPWEETFEFTVQRPPAGTVPAPVQFTATLTVALPVIDPDPNNNSGSAEVLFSADVQLLQNPIEQIDGVSAFPGTLTFSSSTATLDTTVTVDVLNPAPFPVEATLVVASDDTRAVSGGSQVVTRTWTLPAKPLGNPDPAEDPQDFIYTVTRPAAPSTTTETVTFTATLTIALPIVDPDSSNNSGNAGVTLSYPIVITGPAAVPQGQLAITDGFYREVSPAHVVQAAVAERSLAGASHTFGPTLVETVPVRTSAIEARRVPGILPASAPRAAVVPLDVPSPAKPPVQDSVSLQWITPVSTTFGVSESHPAFGWVLNDGVFEPVLLLTERAMWSVVSEVSIDPEGGVVVEHRPAASRISDALPGDGADRRTVVNGAAGAVGRPAYSPDGRFVAFDRATCDRELVSAVGCALWGSEIVVALADGTGPQAVYPSASPRPPGTLDRNPAWSPDGTAIAFTRELPPSAGENSAIWLARGLDIGADPVAPADLVADTVVQLTSPVYAQTVGQIDEFDDEPAWSPDGARIAFTRGRIDTSYLTGVYESSLGSDILVENRPTPGMHDQDIWVVAVGTGDVAPLLAEEVGAVPDDEGCPESATVVCRGGDDRGPDWSPDGARIVYEHTGWLYLADPAARVDLGPLTGPRVLDPAADLPTYPDDTLAPPPKDPASPAAASFPALEWAQDPAWSPDGGRIAFAGQPRGRPDQRGVYWLTVPSDPGAREIRQVAQQPQPEMQPDWQPTADLAITLTAVPASVLLGDGSVLTAVVTNEGPATGFGATVALTLPAGLTAGALPAGCAAGTPVTCALGDIASGASATVAIPVTGATAGPQSATATTASRTVDPDPADNTASATVTVGAPAADLAVSLSAAPASIRVGEGSVLTAVVTNAGPQTAAGSTLTVNVPAGLTPGALPAGCEAGPPISCGLGDLPSGGSATVAIPVTGSAAGVLTATAQVQSTTADPDPSDNTASATVTVGAPAADLAVSLSAAPASIRVGEGSVLTAVVTNAGPQTAAGSTLTVDLPTGLVQGTLPAGCAAGPPISCSLGDLPSGGSATVAIPVTGSAAGVLTATAQVQSTTADPDPSNNSAAASLTVAALQADVSVQMAVDPLPGYVGGPQTVTVTVVNAGPDAATVTLSVDLPEQIGPPDDDDCLTAAGCSLGLVAVGATVIREIETEPVEAFRERATAEVSADVSDPDTDNNLDSVRVRVLQPQVLLLPPLGPPGFVTQARGVDFPPGGRVSLEWELGLNASTTPIKVSKGGTFSVPVVVLPRDQLGPRAIVATRVKGLRFSPVSADFLVVPRTQSPPDFVGRG